jgi:hypothetical protein
MGTIIDFMFNGIANEAPINDGTTFICFSSTTFITGVDYTKIPFIATFFFLLSLLF